MGEAYVLHSVSQPDGTFAPSADEYQAGKLIESHHAGDAFEGSSKEGYEYIRHGGSASPIAVHHEVAAHPAAMPQGTVSHEGVGVLPHGSVEKVDASTAVSGAAGPDHGALPHGSVEYAAAAQTAPTESGALSAAAAENPVFAAENTRMLTEIFHYRAGLFGPRVFDRSEYSRLQGARMSDILDPGARFTPDLRAPIRRLIRLFERSRVAYTPGETVANYLQRVVQIRTQGR